MNCTNCAKPLVDGVNFCPYCGKPVDRSSAPTDTVTWEYCQIEAYWFAKLISWKCFFWANAVGRYGTYGVGWSDEYTVRTNPPAGSGGQASEALSGLASSLAGDEWEATPERGESWWMVRFRRRECYSDFSMGQVDSKQTNHFDGAWTFKRCPAPGGIIWRSAGCRGTARCHAAPTSGRASGCSGSMGSQATSPLASTFSVMA